MFDDVGGKIKQYAKAVFWIITIVKWVLIILYISKIHSIAIYPINMSNAILGTMPQLYVILIGLLSTIIDYIVALFVYAIGEVVQNTKQINERVSDIEKELIAAKFTDNTPTV